MANELKEQLLEKIKTNKEGALETNAELRSLVEQLMARTTAAEDALDQARMTI